MIEQHYRPAEVARRLSLSEDAILRACKTGALRSLVPPNGRARLIPESAVLEWLQNGEQARNVPASVIEMRRAG